MNPERYRCANLFRIKCQSLLLFSRGKTLIVDLFDEYVQKSTQHLNRTRQ